MKKLCGPIKGVWTVLVASAVALGFFVTAASGPALANGAGNNIAGSPHDFSDGLGSSLEATWNFRNEICRVCHAPHDKNRDTASVGLLWNHQVSTQVYTLYASSTLDGAIGQPDGTAKLCLGCHDGTVGIDQFDSRVDNPGTIFMADVDEHFRIPNLPGEEGTSLMGTHPISIAYNVGDTGLNDPNAATYAFSGATVASVLDNGKVQCSSCHDVHDGLAEAVPGTHLLREPNTVSAGGTASGLCLTCHRK